MGFETERINTNISKIKFEPKGKSSFLPASKSENCVWDKANSVLASEKEQTAKNIQNPFGIKIDGKIGNLNQSRMTGDCWLLAGLKSLSLTKEGAALIKNSISQNPQNGDVTVTLKGVNETYCFTVSEIMKVKHKLASGDNDALVFEMAVAKYREKLLENGNFNRKTENYAFNSNLDKRVGKGTKDVPLNAGTSQEIFFLLTGKKSEYYMRKPGFNKILDFSIRERISINRNANDNLDYFLNLMKENPKKYAMNVNFSDNADLYKGIKHNHSYAIKRVNKKSVVVINPMDTSKEIKIPKSIFKKTCKMIISCDPDSKNTIFIDFKNASFSPFS